MLMSPIMRCLQRNFHAATVSQIFEIWRLVGTWITLHRIHDDELTAKWYQRYAIISNIILHYL